MFDVAYKIYNSTRNIVQKRHYWNMLCERFSSSIHCLPRMCFSRVCYAIADQKRCLVGFFVLFGSHTYEIFFIPLFAIRVKRQRIWAGTMDIFGSSLLHNMQRDEPLELTNPRLMLAYFVFSRLTIRLIFYSLKSWSLNSSYHLLESHNLDRKFLRLILYFSAKHLWNFNAWFCWTPLKASGWFYLLKSTVTFYNMTNIE